MIFDAIDFSKISYFSKEICDYISHNQQLTTFYDNAPTLEGLSAQIQNKSNHLSQDQRKKLSETINKQYCGINTTALTQSNIEALKYQKTFTTTTGHQLNIFGGPLYFLYKIITAINTAKYLKSQFPNYNFVPVYWMATEDHDFEEINHFVFRGKKISWNRQSSGVVGKLNTKGLENVFRIFSQQLGDSQKADTLKALFKKSYLENSHLASATRTFVNELFGNCGLVIIDGDAPILKTAFIPCIKDDLTQQTSHKIVNKTNKSLAQRGYKIQVNPREINLFYLKKNLRERIIRTKAGFSVNNTNITWKTEELLDEVSKNPENFSPNVLLRPLYQEVILPNICYVGGSNELVYWLQLKDVFKHYEVPFPVLMLRHSALLIGDKQFKKIKKLNINNEDLFLSKVDLINKRIREISNIDFSSQKQTLQKQFKEMYDIANQTDASFLGAVKAQETKQIKGLEKLEKRLLKAQKRKLSDEVNRYADLKEELFPSEKLQERISNFSEFYLEYGEQLIPKLVSCLKPFHYKFIMISQIENTSNAF